MGNGINRIAEDESLEVGVILGHLHSIGHGRLDEKIIGIQEADIGCIAERYA